jgi:hypothetical protein
MKKACLVLLAMIGLLQGCASVSRREARYLSEELSAKYFILGMLDESWGHEKVDGNRVIESFWDDEREAAEVFERYLYKLKKERGVETQIRKEEDEIHIRFWNGKLAEIIDSFYSQPYEPAGERELDGEWRRVSYAHIDRSDFEWSTRKERLAYLAGAYCRYGGGNAFVNAWGKDDVLVELLLEFDCDDITEVEEAAIPGRYRIVFTPSYGIRDFLGINKYYGVSVTEVSERDLLMVTGNKEAYDYEEWLEQGE